MYKFCAQILCANSAPIFCAQILRANFVLEFVVQMLCANFARKSCAQILRKSVAPRSSRARHVRSASFAAQIGHRKDDLEIGDSFLRPPRTGPGNLGLIPWGEEAMENLAVDPPAVRGGSGDTPRP